MEKTEDRLSLERKEQEYFMTEYSKDPSLFATSTLYENSEFLRQFGIHIPEKESFADGYYKLFPQDFIVEEIRPDGSVTTIGLAPEAETSVPQSPSGIIHATLVKCNLSTLEAVDELSKAFGCDKAKIGYAGIKDKDAVTAQRISISGVDPERISSFSHTHMFLKDFESSDAPIRKGILGGNRFTVYIRTSPEFFEPARANQFVRNIAKAKKDGFYNFYYLQRFGAPRYNNFSVGVDLLKGDYESATKRILTDTSEIEWPFIRNVRSQILAAWGDWEAILKIMTPMPIFFREERKVVERLAKEPAGFRAALAQVQDKVGIICYSVASLFFNEYVAGRLEAGMPVPKELPLLFSADRRDTDTYKEFLTALGLYPLSFRNVEAFRSVRLERRTAPTMGTADIRASNVTDQGVIFAFSLGKGEYATTFMSHFFNLVSGKPPEFVSRDIVDTKALINEGPAAETFERFAAVIRPKEGVFSAGIGQE